MQVNFRYLLLSVSTLLLVSACFSPKTPQEITEAFWQAVIEGDKQDVVKYSTLADAKNHDRFSRDWNGYQPRWGKVVIDQTRASIDAEFISPANSKVENQKITTYLILLNNEWTVDYDQTARAMRGDDALSDFVGKLNSLGEDLAKQLEFSAQEFESEIEKFSKEFEIFSKQFEQQAIESLEAFAAELEASIRKLEESINRALKDKDNRLSDEQKRKLKEVSNDLGDDADRLSEPTAESIVDSGKGVSAAQLKLHSIDNDSLNQYRQEWRGLFDRIESSLRKQLDQVSGMGEGA